MSQGFAVLPLEHVGAGLVETACDWFAEMSGGAAVLAPVWHQAPRISPADRLALTGTPELVRRALAELAPAGVLPLLVFGPPAARAHCWNLEDGRRYALVPAPAALAVLAHELGHLLFGWPDLRLPAGTAARCLMAPMAGRAPAPPSAPMRVAAGWEVPQPLVAGLDPAGLACRRSHVWANLLIERQEDALVGFRRFGRSVSLAFAAALGPADACALAMASRAIGPGAERAAQSSSHAGWGC